MSTVRPSSGRTRPTRPNSVYGVGAPRSEIYQSDSSKSFYRIPNDDQRNVSLDSLSDSSSIKLASFDWRCGCGKDRYDSKLL